MTSPASPVLARSSSLSSLTAWLSVCLLAAAWGPKLESSIREQWAALGAFGLAAALGLEVASHTRGLVKKRTQRNAASQRITRSVVEPSAQTASLFQLGEMLRGICQDSGTDSTLSGQAGEEPRLRFRLPVQIRPLTGDETSTPGTESFVAHVRNISATGVGLVHKMPINNPSYVVDFPLKTGASISVLVHLSWQNRLADGPYQSGGKLIEIVQAADGKTELIDVATNDAPGPDLTPRSATVAT